MQRRTALQIAGAIPFLACPTIARQNARTDTLRFVPTPDLTALDPMVVGNRATHTHAFMVFDTLFGIDAAFRTRPQMVAEHTVEQDGRLWLLRLRPGLRFHDGAPVLARDAVASIRRWAARDGFGQALMAATDTLDAPDDATIRFILARPFPLLATALAGSTRTVPCIMPERLARTDPFRQVTEMVGSGPYRFVAAEFDAGARATYQRFEAYVPRPGEAISHTAGGKIAHVYRVEWISIGDSATAASALLRGEVDWLEWPSPDQLPLLSRAEGIRIEVTEPSGSIGIMRFNHRLPPFDNPAIRRATLGAIDPSEFMMAVAGTDRALWTDRVGLLDATNPLATSVATEALANTRNDGRARHALTEAGYRGEPVTVLVVAGNSVIPLLSQVGAEQLRRAGLNVDEQTMDLGTMLRRVQNSKALSSGGWNVHFGIFDGAVNLSPVTNDYLRGDGNSGAPGWMTSPPLEALRADFLAAPTLDEQRQVTERIQRQKFEDVPYVPLGSWVHQTAFRADLAGITQGFPIFSGVRRV